MKLNIVNDENKLNLFFIIVVLVGLIAYYVGLTNLYFWFGLLILRLFAFNRKEFGFFALLYGSSLFGRMFASQMLYLSTIVLSLIFGIIALRNEIVKILTINEHSFVFLIVLIGFFFIEYLIGPQTDYAHEKIVKLTVRSIVWLTAFLIFFQSKEISPKRIAIAFLILSILYLSQAAQLYHIRPSSIWDFSFFRYYCEIIGRNENRTLIVNWQTLGYLSLASAVFWIMKKDFFQGDVYNSFIILFVSCWIVALSGTRQSILIFCLLAVVRFMQGKKKILTISNVMTIILILSIFYLLIDNMGSSYYERALDANKSLPARLNRDITTPFEIWSISPIFGVGFGGYPLYTHKDYPHNFFIEILCELGVSGMLVICGLIVLFLLTSRGAGGFKILSANGSYIFLLFPLLFLRGMIGGDLADNICFICLLLSFVSLNPLDEDIQIEESCAEG